MPPYVIFIKNSQDNNAFRQDFFQRNIILKITLAI